jgi:LmbE family N-acetylglucosaminyl deacetylase
MAAVMSSSRHVTAVDDDESDRMAGREIVGAGTSEAEWQAWPGLAALPECSLDALLLDASRLVVVAPHPDDEVLSGGGLLAMAAARDVEVLVVSVSDGAASHPGSSQWPADKLAMQRHAESVEGLRRLGVSGGSLMRLDLPDGGLQANEAALGASDLVLTTWRWDGHPDHEATARAARSACDSARCRLLQAPVWMWHWAAPADGRVPWSRLRRLRLPADVQRKRNAAIEAHATQLSPQEHGAAPVLSRAALLRLQRQHEYFFVDAA